MYYNHNYYYMYFIVEIHSVLYLLLSIDKFCIHSGRFLVYKINNNNKINAEL